MKIGILTFHRAHNYGAVLQCYALQEILRRNGHDVRVIDYRQPYIEQFYSRFSTGLLMRRFPDLKAMLEYVKNCMKKFMWSPFRKRYFNDFVTRYIKLSEKCTSQIPQDFDCYVIGSDQLWSMHCLGGEFDPVYLGEFRRPASSLLVGYSISADVRSVNALAGRLKDIVPSFDAISMREEKISGIVSSSSGHDCSVTVDPTLLTDSSLWEPVIDEKWSRRNYILVYEVRWNKDTKGALRRKAERLAEKIGDGCEVIDVSRMKYPVRDFVSLFRYARYVVTTSFHGIVFSLLFETPFYALPLWDNYDLRYRELLTSLGAADRLVSFDDELLPVPVDFAPVSRRMEELRSESMDYLDKALTR